MNDFLIPDTQPNKLFDINYYNGYETLHQEPYSDVYMQLIYILSDVFSVHAETTDFCMNKGELIAVLPGNKITIDGAEPNGKFCIISFKPDLLKTITDIPHLNTDLSYWYFNIKKSSAGILKLNQKQIIKIDGLLLDYKSAKSQNRHMICTSLMFELLTFIGIFLKLSNIFCNGKSTRNILVNQAIAYIDNNFRNEIKISDIADYLFINQKHLIHIFKQKTGVTVKQYINQQRINFVKKLLSTYSMSPKEVFLLSGFNDYSAFFRAFKKATGDSPSDFRKLPTTNTQEEEK